MATIWFTHQEVRKVNNTQTTIIVQKDDKNVNKIKDIKVKISIPEDINDNLRMQKINRIYDILAPKIDK